MKRLTPLDIEFGLGLLLLSSALLYGIISAVVALSEWELWAVANETIRRHGEQAPLFVASRLGELALAGDEAGVATWRQVAHRVEKLRASPSLPS